MSNLDTTNSLDFFFNFHPALDHDTVKMENISKENIKFDECKYGTYLNTTQLQDISNNYYLNNQNDCVKTFDNSHCIQGFSLNNVQGF